MLMVGSVFSAYARSGWLHLTFTHVVFHGMFRNFVQVDRPFQLSVSSKITSNIMDVTYFSQFSGG